ncbi:MAG: S9 family peptidase, partial [Pedobacter sp.]
MSYRVSPDGAYISYLKQDGKQTNLFVEPVNGGEIIQVTRSEGRKVNFYSWVSNDELIYYKEQTGAGRRADLFIISRDGKNERQLTSNEKSRMQVLDDQLIDGKFLLIASNRRDSAVIDVYRLNVRDGKLEMAAKNPGTITDWITDADGKLRLATSSNGVNETLLYRPDEQHEFKPILSNTFSTTVRPLAFSESTPNIIYAISDAGRDKSALVEIDCNTGKETKVLFSNDSLNVIDAQYSRINKRMVFVVYETWKRQKHYLDEKVKELYTDLDALLPNTESRITDRDRNENIFIVRTFTDRNPGSYYLYFANEKRIRKLGDFNSSIRE